MHAKLAQPAPAVAAAVAAWLWRSVCQGHSLLSRLCIVENLMEDTLHTSFGTELCSLNNLGGAQEGARGRQQRG